MLPMSPPSPLTPIIHTIKEASQEFLAWAEVSKSLLAKGLPENYINTAQCSPLWAALTLKDLDLCKKIVELGLPINQPGEHFAQTVLLQAICLREEEIALYLIKKGAHLQCQGHTGWTYLHQAVVQDMPIVVEALIQGEAVVNAQAVCAAEHLSTAQYSGESTEGFINVTPLCLALRAENLTNNQNIALALIQNGACVYMIPNGFNYLHLAAAKGYDKVCKILLDRGMDVNSICHYPVDAEALSSSLKIEKSRLSSIWERTPLDYAAYYNQAATAKLLLENGAKCPFNKNNYFYHPLLIAIAKGNEELIKPFLMNGAMEQEIAGFEIPWMFLILSNPTKIFELGAKLGANLHHKFNNQNSYLHFATRFNDKSACEFLIKSGVDIHALNSKNQNVLHSSASNKNADLISFFLQQKVEARCLDNECMTPLMYTEEKNFSDPEQYVDLKEADRGLTSMMRKLRLLGLRFSLEGEAFEGSPKFITYADLASSLESYLKNEPDWPPFFYTLPKIIEKSYTETFEDILSRLDRGEIISVSTGWKGHETVIVATKNYLIKGNRGDGSGGKPGLTVYKIKNPSNLSKAIKILLANRNWEANPDELLKRLYAGKKEMPAWDKANISDIIQHVRKENINAIGEHYEQLKNEAVKQHMEFFNQTLIELLDLDCLCHLSKKEQTAGNCTWEAAKIALRGGLIAYYLQQNPNMTVKEVLPLCNSFFSSWKKYDYAQSLQVLEQAEAEPLVKEFIDIEKVYDELFALNFDRKETLDVLCQLRPRLLEWITKPDPKLISYGYKHNNPRIIKWLLGHNVQPDMSILRYNHPKIDQLHLDYFIQKGIKANIAEDLRFTPLHFFCGKKDVKPALELLKNWKYECELSNESPLLTKAINSVDFYGNTLLTNLLLPPLFISLDVADIESRQEVLDLMIECGALSAPKNDESIFFQKNAFQTVIENAKEYKLETLNLIKSLLRCPDASAAINANMQSRLTIFDYIQDHDEEWSVSLAKLLIDHGNFSFPDEKGLYPRIFEVEEVKKYYLEKKIGK
jgi:ankyrin repeat protein